MAHLSLSLLGPFRVTLDGEPLTGFESNKVRALLAYLAVEQGQPHRRDSLAGLLWPNRPNRVALASLRNALANLRKTIQDRPAGGDRNAQTVRTPFLQVTRETIQFDPASDHWLDVAEFRALAETTEAGQPLRQRQEEAVALYRGDFLAGFSVRGSPALDDWLLLVRERLLRQALSALRRLTAACEQSGEFARACEFAWRQVELAPWEEEAHRQLMRLLALNGQRTAALAQYEACRRTLKEELDVEPAAETERLYERIRNGLEEPMGVSRPSHNLPAQLLPFVGREALLAEIAQRLADPGCRLLALVGPGGSGKTRLAVEAAAAGVDAYRDGVCFVALAPVHSVEAIVPTVAQALGFAFYSGGEPKEQLLSYLCQKNVLLLLDSFEHLVEGAGLVPEILRRSPEVTIMVTSRGGLHVQGEHRFPISGMSYPALTPTDQLRSDPSPTHRRGVMGEDALRFSAVQLFTVGARRAQPGFELTHDNLADVVRICRLVDGMPLAILLAAAWVKMLTPAEIAAEIEGQMTGLALDFLETDLRDAPERQRSMRAVFDHSWHLLTTRERAVMQALAVFRGGFARQAAQEVAGASLRELMALVDKSLLHRTPAGQYELHELLRQYALESLGRTPDASRAVRDRHSAHYAAALANWATTLKGPRQQATLAEIEANIGNARAAWDWAAGRGQAERLGQAMQGLDLFYRWRGRYQEGESAFRLATDKLAELAKGPTEMPAGHHLSVRAEALAWQGYFSRHVGCTELSWELLEKSLDLLDDPAAAGQDTRRERAFTLRIMGETQRFSGDPEEARRLQAQSLALYRALGDRWETAYIASELGAAMQGLGDFEEAGRLHQEALDIRRALGDPKGMIHSLGGLAIVFTSRGQLEKAERLAREAVALCHEAGERTYYLMLGLFVLVQALHYKGEFVEGHALLEEGLPQISGDLTAHKFSPKVLWLLGMAKAHLGRYTGARVHLQRALILARKASTLWIGAATFGLGLVALAGQEHKEARRWLQESVALLKESKQRSEVGWALAGLGGAVRGLGRLSEARKHLCRVLQISAEIRDLPTPMHALPVAALLLADLGKRERAVEIYALASRYGFVANSRLWEDIAGQEIAALAATLPPEVVAAAQERGRARDLWATVEELLVELAVEEPPAR